VFTFEYDPANRLLVAKTAGFWTVEIADRYCDRMAIETRRARQEAGRLNILVDVSEHGVQPPEVMDRLRRARELCLARPTDRLAILVARGLNSAQSRRVTAKHGQEVNHVGNFQIFENREAALAWLGSTSAESSLSAA
jgi:hypothetical protein